VPDERWTGPDLSGYSVTDRAAYEWYLSDHPWARTERLRRAEADCAGAVARAAEVRAWSERVDGADLAGRDPVAAAALRRLSATLRPLADRAQLRSLLDAAEPDDVRVIRLRAELTVRERASGDGEYRYPEQLIGPGAATRPPPGLGR
jgi:hypothetical protein